MNYSQVWKELKKQTEMVKYPTVITSGKPFLSLASEGKGWGMAVWTH